jgi:hypothetical protein
MFNTGYIHKFPCKYVNLKLGIITLIVSIFVGKEKIPSGEFDNIFTKLTNTIYNNEVRGEITRPERDLRKSEVYNVEAVVKCAKKQ